MHNKIGIIGKNGPLAHRIIHSFAEEDIALKIFDRTSGYDLSQKNTIPKIVDESKNLDVLINCASFEFSQVEFLYQWFETFKEEQKLLISIGSRAATYANSSRRVYRYGIEKNALKLACEQLFLIPSKCRVTCLDVSYFCFSPQSKDKVRTTQYKDFFKCLKWLIDMPCSTYINHLSLSGNHHEL